MEFISTEGKPDHDRSEISAGKHSSATTKQITSIMCSRNSQAIQGVSTNSVKQHYMELCGVNTPIFEGKFDWVG